VQANASGFDATAKIPAPIWRADRFWRIARIPQKMTSENQQNVSWQNEWHQPNQDFKLHF